MQRHHALGSSAGFAVQQKYGLTMVGGWSGEDISDEP